MATEIDFREWTDAQLEAAAGLAHRSAHGPALLAELQRRRDDGSFGTDGSHEHVAQLRASNPGLRGGRRPRRNRRNPD